MPQNPMLQARPRGESLDWARGGANSDPFSRPTDRRNTPDFRRFRPTVKLDPLDRSLFLPDRPVHPTVGVSSESR